MVLPTVSPWTVGGAHQPARRVYLPSGTDPLNHRFVTATSVLTLDPAGLPLRDRAVLRILHRAEAATAAQLTVLAYGHRRIANRRLLHMWRAGIVERTAVARTEPYGSGPYAYRLSDATRRRMGATATRRRGSAYLRHTLDIVEVVTRLIAATSPGTTLVECWLPETACRGMLGASVRPDSLLILRGGRGAGVVWLELDEGTQHQAAMRDKLTGYERAFAHRPGSLLLIVVPNATRLAWLRRTAALDLRRLVAYASTLDDMMDGVDALVTPLPTGRPCAMSQILNLDRDHAPSPVGSVRWIQMLGAGGGEDLEI